MQRANYSWIFWALLGLATSVPAQHLKGAESPLPRSIVNAASFEGEGVSGGEIASLFGEQMGPIAGVARETGLGAANIADVEVTFDGIAALLYYVSSRQINLHVPPEVAGRPNTRVVVRFAGLSGSLDLPVVASRPGVFARNGGGSGPALAFNYDGSPNTVGNPAPKGSRITIYATGLVDEANAGKAESIEVSLGGHGAPLRAAREVPYAPGLFQIEVVVPAEIEASPAGIGLTIGAAASQSGVTVFVDPERSVDAETLTYIEQGWRPAERQWYYNTTQGSQLIPYYWFLALEQPGDERPFRANAFIDSLGYLPNPPDTVRNPDGLPVGFVKDADPDTGDWLGLTCAACHTGQINYRGAGIRIDGAPALSDFEGLYQSLLVAMEETLQDQDKWQRFSTRVSSAEKSKAPEHLRTQVELFTEDLRGFARRSRSPSPYGFGRLDAFGILTNEIVGAALGRPENVRIPNAPVSYPFLWNTPRLEWVQWNGTAHIPLLRNIGEVLGVFAQLTLTGDPADRFKSSADVHNLFLLEEQVALLKPPRWPESVLGPLDAVKASRGKALFESVSGGCSDCHLGAPPYPLTESNKYGQSFVPVTMVPFTIVGTDSQAILDFSIRVANTGELADAVGGNEVALVGSLARIVFQQVMRRQFAELGLSEQEQLEYMSFREDLDPAGILSYKAGPLAGIWATAPYLHNGSVPNLYELLLPPQQRSDAFHVGGREFDPERVGFDTGPGNRTSLLDINVSGNANTGHEYGTTLSEEERWDLIEYLKSL
jgi:uncharacterized protein (TIGR03437 family)